MLALLQQLGRDLTLRPGATDAAIAQAQRDLAWTFPAEYVEFLRASDGVVGMLVSDDYIDLWPVEELLDRNRGYRFPEECPEVLAFGSDGGGEAFVFRRSNAHIAIMPFITLDMADAIPIAERFTDFLRRPRPAHWS